MPSEDVSFFKSTFGRFIANVDRFDMRPKLHASPPFRLQIREPEIFVRFSAFRNDRRIQPDGSLLPGTYVTSGGTRSSRLADMPLLDVMPFQTQFQPSIGLIYLWVVEPQGWLVQSHQPLDKRVVAWKSS